MARSSGVMVGGGLVGASVAYGLAEGASVTLLDAVMRPQGFTREFRTCLGSGQGRACRIMPTGPAQDLYQNLLTVCWSITVAMLELKQEGGLRCLGEDEYNKTEASILQVAQPAGCRRNDRRMIGVEDVREMVPIIGAITGASYSPHDGHVNALICSKSAAMPNNSVRAIWQGQSTIHRQRRRWFRLKPRLVCSGRAKW